MPLTRQKGVRKPLNIPDTYEHAARNLKLFKLSQVGATRDAEVIVPEVDLLTRQCKSWAKTDPKCIVLRPETVVRGGAQVLVCGTKQEVAFTVLFSLLSICQDATKDCLVEGLQLLSPTEFQGEVCCSFTGWNHVHRTRKRPQTRANATKCGHTQVTHSVDEVGHGAPVRLPLRRICLKDLCPRPPSQVLKPNVSTNDSFERSLGLLQRAPRNAKPQLAALVQLAQLLRFASRKRSEQVDQEVGLDVDSLHAALPSIWSISAPESAGTMSYNSCSRPSRFSSTACQLADILWSQRRTRVSKSVPSPTSAPVSSRKSTLMDDASVSMNISRSTTTSRSSITIPWAQPLPYIRARRSSTWARASSTTNTIRESRVSWGCWTRYKLMTPLLKHKTCHMTGFPAEPTK